MTGTLRRLLTCSAAVSLLAAGAACGPNEDEQPTTLSPLPSTPTASKTTPSAKPTSSKSNTTGMTDRQQVKALYLDFLANYRSAQDHPKKDRRRFLSQWMIDPALEYITESFNKQERNNQRSVGEYNSNIISIRVKGLDATVDDCVDQSRFAIKNTKTGKLVGDQSSDYFWAVATLRKTKKGWRIDQTGSEKKKSCAGD